MCAGKKLDSVPQDGENPPQSQRLVTRRPRFKARKKHCWSLTRVDVARSRQVQTDCLLDCLPANKEERLSQKPRIGISWANGVPAPFRGAQAQSQ